MFKKMLALAFVSIELNLYAELLPYTGTPLLEQAEMVITNVQGTTPVGERFRICNYNIEFFEDGVNDGENRTADIAEHHAKMVAATLDKINADVVILQEVENGRILQQLNRQLKTPFPLGYVSLLGTKSYYGEQKLNIAVLSKYPLEQVQEIDFGPLQGPGRPTRGHLRFVVNLGDQHKLLAYGVHLKSNYGDSAKNISQRSHALALLRQDAEKIISENPDVTWEVVLVGDMNVDPDQPQFATDTSFEPLNGWIDLWRGRPLNERITLPTRHGNPEKEFPPATFDRFFISPSFNEAPWKAGPPAVLPEGTDTENVNTLPGHGNHASDHYPVYLDVTK